MTIYLNKFEDRRQKGEGRRENNNVEMWRKN